MIRFSPHKMLLQLLTEDPGGNLVKARGLPRPAKTTAIVGPHVDSNTKPEKGEKEFHLPWQKVAVGKVVTISSSMRQNSSCLTIAIYMKNRVFPFISWCRKMPTLFKLAAKKCYLAFGSIRLIFIEILP